MSDVEVPPDKTDAMVEMPTTRLRELRSACMEEETGLSYMRRMVQGPLDIVRGELVRRASGGGGDLAGLVGDLPNLLADDPAPTGGRLAVGMQPTKVDPELQGELDALLSGAGVAGATDLTHDELVQLARGLEALERKVSERRRALHRSIDSYQAELARRYRTGEADVGSLLS